MYIVFLTIHGLSYVTMPLALPAGPPSGGPSTLAPTMRVLHPVRSLYVDNAVLVTLVSGITFSVTLLADCKLGAGLQCVHTVTSQLTGAACAPSLDAALVASALLSPGFFHSADQTPQLLVLPVAGSGAGSLLVLDGHGGCAAWGTLLGYPLQVAASDVNNDDLDDVLIADAMQTAIGISDGRGAFKLRYGGGSGLEGAVNVAPFVAHQATGDVCRPTNASRGVMKGAWWSVHTQAL